jgi:hypothetical protein
MKEPWESPTWQAWRIYADYLMETQAPDPAIKRAVKYALGLIERPKLVLIAQAVHDVPRRWQTCGILRGGDWNHYGMTNYRWVTPSWYHREMSRPYGERRADEALERTLATPADFPGMTVLPYYNTSSLAYSPLTADFYSKASELVRVRCRRGEITVRHGRCVRNPWILWTGV